MQRTDYWQAIYGEAHGVRVGLILSALADVPDEVFADALERLSRFEAMGPMVDPTAWLDGTRSRNSREQRDICRALRDLRQMLPEVLNG